MIVLTYSPFHYRSTEQELITAIHPPPTTHPSTILSFRINHQFPTVLITIATDIEAQDKAGHVLFPPVWWYHRACAAAALLLELFFPWQTQWSFSHFFQNLVHVTILAVPPDYPKTGPSSCSFILTLPDPFLPCTYNHLTFYIWYSLSLPIRIGRKARTWLFHSLLCC